MRFGIQTDAWKEQAECRQGWDPDMWFPEQNELSSPRTRMAKVICGRCPVAAECYEYGRTERSGIWGGVYQTRAGRLETAAS